MNHSPLAYVPGWRATLTRGDGAANRWRARVSHDDGPDAAAAAVVARFNETMGNDHFDAWHVFGAALSLDSGSAYAYAVGPRHCAETMRAALSGDA